MPSACAEAGVSNGAPIAATASPVPARNTLRRVRIVGALIMSILRVEGAACQRGSGNAGKGRKIQCRSQLSLSIHSDHLAKSQAFHYPGPGNDAPYQANSLN